MNRKQNVQTPRVASTVNRFEVLRNPFNRNEYKNEAMNNFNLSSQGASVGKENKSRFVWVDPFSKPHKTQSVTNCPTIWQPDMDIHQRSDPDNTGESKESGKKNTRH